MRRLLGERLRAGLVLAAVCGLVSSCASTPTDEVRISVKRIALSLAFEDEELAKEPVAPEHIIQYLPAPPALVASGDLTPYTTPERPALTLAPEKPLCPSAPSGAAVGQAVGVTVNEPPKPGWYRRFNKGKLSIAGGALPLSLPFPRVTLIEISDVHDVQRPNMRERHVGDVATDDAPPVADAAAGAGGTKTATRFTVAHHIATITVTDVYEYDAESFRLVQRTTKTDGGTSVFTPTPQIALTELGNYGNDWKEGGADRESNTAMTVQGSIVKQEPVDVCGTLVDTLRFANDEQLVNLSTQETSGTQDVPNSYNIAPHYNGMMVREEKHFTQVVTVDDLKLVIDWDYISTLGNFDPFPTKEAALKGLPLL
jgi:hypothetical protein